MTANKRPNQVIAGFGGNSSINKRQKIESKTSVTDQSPNQSLLKRKNSDGLKLDLKRVNEDIDMLEDFQS